MKSWQKGIEIRHSDGQVVDVDPRFSKLRRA